MSAFCGRVSGPQANPYRMGHGRALESPDKSSMRNPHFANRSMGVTETSPSVPRRDGEGMYKTSRRAHPERLKWAQARGLDARLHLLVMHRTQTNAKYMHMAPLRPAGILLMPAGTNTSHIGKEHPRSCKASGSRPASPLARPPGIAQQPRGKKVPSSNVSICGILTDTPADARGLLSGTAIRLP
jgi:hypothetical protein